MPRRGAAAVVATAAVAGLGGGGEEENTPGDGGRRAADAMADARSRSRSRSHSGTREGRTPRIRGQEVRQLSEEVLDVAVSVSGKERALSTSAEAQILGGAAVCHSWRLLELVHNLRRGSDAPQDTPPRHAFADRDPSEAAGSVCESMPGLGSPMYPTSPTLSAASAHPSETYASPSAIPSCYSPTPFADAGSGASVTPVSPPTLLGGNDAVRSPMVPLPAVLTPKPQFVAAPQQHPRLPSPRGSDARSPSVASTAGVVKRVRSLAATRQVPAAAYPPRPSSLRSPGQPAARAPGGPGQRRIEIDDTPTIYTVDSASSSPRERGGFIHAGSGLSVSAATVSPVGSAGGFRRPSVFTLSPAESASPLAAPSDGGGTTPRSTLSQFLADRRGGRSPRSPSVPRSASVCTTDYMVASPLAGGGPRLVASGPAGSQRGMPLSGAAYAHPHAGMPSSGATPTTTPTTGKKGGEGTRGRGKKLSSAASAFLGRFPSCRRGSTVADAVETETETVMASPPALPAAPAPSVASSSFYAGGAAHGGSFGGLSSGDLGGMHMYDITVTMSPRVSRQATQDFFFVESFHRREVETEAAVVLRHFYTALCMMEETVRRVTLRRDEERAFAACVVAYNTEWEAALMKEMSSHPHALFPVGRTVDYAATRAF